MDMFAKGDTMTAMIFRLTTLRKTALAVLPVAFFLAGCSSLKLDPPEKEEKPVSVLTGKPGGIKLSELMDDTQSGDSMPVNALLWRAALDIASFVPLDDVDTFGGTIVTEWYQTSAEAEKRLKLSFFVTGLELRSDAVKVRAYIQSRQDGNWIDAGQDEKLARRLEDLTLTRARELRAASASESVK
jgi:hypothetical protein